MTSQELRDRAVGVLAKAETLHALAETEDRGLNESETTDFDSFMADHKSLLARADAADSLNAGAAKLAASKGRKATGTETSLESTSLEDFKAGDITTHDRLLDDPKRGFAHVGEFAQCVWQADPNVNMGHDERLKIMAAAGTGLEQGDRLHGGATIMPPSFSTTIWDGVNAESDSLLARTDQFTFDPGKDEINMLASNESSRANGSRHGGLQGYWKDELSEMTSSRSSLRDMTLRAEELYVFAFVSDKLLRNSSIALGQMLTRDSADEINFKIGDAIINGTGSAQPKGLLGAAGTINIAKENNQATATIKTANIDKMWARLTPRARTNAVWYINVDTETELQTLVQEVGTAGIPLMRESLRDASVNVMKGRPIIPIEYCSTLGTSGDIILADLSYYASANRGGINSAESIHLKFDVNQTAFRFLFEVDGQPWLNTPITPYKGTNTQAPFITLADRA